MPANMHRLVLSALFLSALACLAAPAGDLAPVESSGIFLAKAEGMPGKIYSGDLAPSQVLEIIRPETVGVTVARFSTSCTCITAGSEKKTFAPGERAFVEVRNVKATPITGATYMVFVELASPTRELLSYDIFVKSGQPGSQAAPAPAPESPAASQPKPPAFKYEDVTPYPSKNKEDASKG